MAPPAYRSGSTAGNATGTNLTVNVPAGVVDNDLLFIVLYREGGSWTMPGGWTQLYDVPSANAGQTTTVAWKRASSEPANYTFNLSSSVWRIATMVALSGGVTTGSPVDISTSAADNNSSVVAPSMTTLTNDVMLLWLTANLAGADVTASTSGMTQGDQLGGCEVWYVTQPTAGATGTKSFGNSGMSTGDWVGIFLAILPDSGVPPDAIPDWSAGYLEAVSVSDDDLLDAQGIIALSWPRRRYGFPLGNRADVIDPPRIFNWRRTWPVDRNDDVLFDNSWWIEPAIDDLSGGTTYPQALAGGLDFAGAHFKLTAKPHNGGLAFAGALTTVRAVLKALAGGLATAGSLVKQTAKPLAGGVASSGSLAKQTGKATAGSLANSGALATVRAILKLLTGGLAASGGLTKRTAKPLAGTVAAAGTLAKQLARALAGAVAFSGSLSTVRVILKALSGGLDAAGSILRRTTRPLAGAAGASGALTKRAARLLTGGVAASGALAIVRQFARVLVGGLASTGALTKRTAKALSGGVDAAGTIVRQTRRTLAGGLMSSGSVVGDLLGGIIMPRLSTQWRRPRFSTLPRPASARTHYRHSELTTWERDES